MKKYKIREQTKSHQKNKAQNQQLFKCTLTSTKNFEKSKKKVRAVTRRTFPQLEKSHGVLGRDGIYKRKSAGVL